MAELDQRTRSALAQLRDDWSQQRSQLGLSAVHRRVRAARLRRRALLSAGALCTLACLGWAGWSLRRTDTAARSAATGVSRHMQFEDGSQPDLLSASARVLVDEVTRERVSVRLLSGSARVDVVPRKERAFRVQCGDVTVEVLGTAFEVLREGARTRVSVLRGRVAVHAPGGSTQLSAGEVGWFPRPAPAPEPPAQPTAAQAEPAPTAHASKKPERRDAGWQAQAERGNYRRAFELLPGSPERVSDDVQELLLAADAARLSGHPAQALPYLRRVIERHAGDQRASLAAFTLGGVLLNQLDRPREAEAAYGRARSMALGPALAQDALARQVEAAQRAGDLPRVRELAREYLRAYPDGRRARWVKELGGS